MASMFSFFRNLLGGNPPPSQAVEQEALVPLPQRPWLEQENEDFKGALRWAMTSRRKFDPDQEDEPYEDYFLEFMERLSVQRGYRLRLVQADRSREVFCAVIEQDGTVPLGVVYSPPGATGEGSFAKVSTVLIEGQTARHLSFVKGGDGDLPFALYQFQVLYAADEA